MPQMSSVARVQTLKVAGEVMEACSQPQKKMKVCEKMCYREMITRGSPER